jgi:chromosomal replication initiator protein
MKQWEEFVQKQFDEMGEAAVKKWLFPLKIIKYDAQNLLLEAKDSFHLLWFEEHIRAKVEKELFNNNGKKIKVSVNLPGSSPLEKKEKKKEPPKKTPFELYFDGLDPLLSFDTFAASPQHKVILTILKERTFTPILLFGGKGTGKTHLLQAAAIAMKAEGLEVLYTRGETFTNHVVSAIRSSEMSLFRQIYRKVDALIIDGIEVLAHKGATQEELFHTFNTLHIVQKPIILSSEKPPHELSFIEPRMISRFEWGISLPLPSPTHEEKKFILEKKCELLKFPLHPKVQGFLIENVGANCSLLIEALQILIYRHELAQKESGRPGKTSSTTLTTSLVKHYLNDLLDKEEKAKLTPKKIIQFIADAKGLKAEEILGASQARDISFSRQLAMAICRKELKLPFKKIGEIFERDHSTVMSAINTVKERGELEEWTKKILSK